MILTYGLFPNGEYDPMAPLRTPGDYLSLGRLRNPVKVFISFAFLCWCQIHVICISIVTSSLNLLYPSPINNHDLTPNSFDYQTLYHQNL